MTSPVLFETNNDCLDVILNRPDEGNLITNEMGMEIARTLRELGPETKLVRLTGRGANFCKGRQAPQIDRATMTPLQVRHPMRQTSKPANVLQISGSLTGSRVPRAMMPKASRPWKDPRISKASNAPRSSWASNPPTDQTASAAI